MLVEVGLEKVKKIDLTRLYRTVITLGETITKNSPFKKLILLFIIYTQAHNLVQKFKEEEKLQKINKNITMWIYDNSKLTRLFQLIFEQIKN
jgi:hypothetical protein